jgi:xeroderma pigmentosum group C-complementing protein
MLDEDEHENAEKKELAASAEDEAIPTSKAAFKTHPLYALASNLNKAEVIDPAGKERIVGIFKGELIYRRSDISVALTAKKWRYHGRKVMEAELSKPAKTVKARKKSAPKTFRALTSYGVSDTSEQKVDDESYVEDDGMDHIFGRWQTEEWSPEPVGPNDEIPVNEYKNIELALLNPGLVHLEVRGIAKVAKKLGIPYAPCLLGFEGHGGNRTPTIRGIVVHEHNADLLRCAYTEWESQAVEQEHAQRRKAIYGRWKRLVVGILTKERLDRQYGGEENK